MRGLLKTLAMKGRLMSIFTPRHLRRIDAALFDACGVCASEHKIYVAKTTEAADIMSEWGLQVHKIDEQGNFEDPDFENEKPAEAIKRWFKNSGSLRYVRMAYLQNGKFSTSDVIRQFEIPHEKENYEY